jgi:hypothetical protein
MLWLPDRTKTSSRSRPNTKSTAIVHSAHLLGKGTGCMLQTRFPRLPTMPLSHARPSRRQHETHETLTVMSGHQISMSSHHGHIKSKRNQEGRRKPFKPYTDMLRCRSAADMAPTSLNSSSQHPEVMESCSKLVSSQMAEKRAGSIAARMLRRRRSFTIGHSRARNAGFDSRGPSNGNPSAHHHNLSLALMSHMHSSNFLLQPCLAWLTTGFGLHMSNTKNIWFAIRAVPITIRCRWRSFALICLDPIDTS